MAKEMKNSGVQWIGEIPIDWSISKIKYIPNEKPDAFVDGDWIESPFITDEGIRYLTSGNIGDGKFKRQGNGYITENTFKILGCKYAYPGDLVFCRLNQPFGRSCILPDDEMRYVIAVDNVILRTNEEKRYICYLTQTAEYQQNIGLMCNGMAMQRISRTKLGDIKISLPSLPEQKAIADFLDAKCADIDGLLADMDQEVKTLADYKKSLIAETVTHCLNPSAPMKQSGIPWLSDVPAHWDIHPVYTYFDQRIHKNILGTEQNLLSLSYGRIITKDIDILGGLLPASFNTYNIVEEGDIIIRPTDLQNDKRSLRTGLVREHGMITSAYIALKPKNNQNSAYFHYLLHTYDVMKVFYNMGNGVRQGLNYSEFSRLMLVAPPQEEQIAIANYLDEKCKVIDESIADKQDQIEKLKAYKASLIYEYVTGKKQVAL